MAAWWRHGLYFLISIHPLFFNIFSFQMIPVDRTTTAKDVRRKILENMSHSLSDAESEEKIKEYVFWWSIVECGKSSEESRGDEKKDEKDKSKGRERNERRVEWDERVWGWRLGNKMGTTLYFKICYKYEDFVCYFFIFPQVMRSFLLDDDFRISYFAVL